MLQELIDNGDQFSVFTEDFESSTALEGWTGGKIDDSQPVVFTSFLGRYDSNDASPFKRFKVPVDADALVIDLDFYEIDDWGGNGTANIYIDGAQIALGPFGPASSEVYQHGITSNGIYYERERSGPPSFLTSGDMVMLDQKHHVRIEISSWASTFLDGFLMVQFETLAGENGGTSGWDNIQISSVYKAPPEATNEATVDADETSDGLFQSSGGDFGTLGNTKSAPRHNTRRKSRSSD